MPRPPGTRAGRHASSTCGMPSALSAEWLGQSAGAVFGERRVSSRACRRTRREGQGLRHGRDQYHQGVAAAQSPLCRGAAHVPRPLRTRRSVPPFRLRRQPDHIDQRAAAGSTRGGGTAAAPGKGAIPAQQRAGAGPGAAEDPPLCGGAYARSAAGVFPARATQGDPERAGDRQGRPHRRDRQIRSAPQEALLDGGGH